MVGVSETKIWRRKDSGQVLIVAALSVSLIIISTVAYVYELGAVTTSTKSPSLNDYVLMVQSGTRHVLVSSLANITHSHANSVLDINLQKWGVILSKQYVFGKCVLGYELVNVSPYSSGVWVSWASNGVGVSSVCGNFSLKLSDRNVNVEKNFFLNMSTVLRVEGEYSRLGGDDKNVTVLVNVLNEDEPALAETIQVYYKNSDQWLEADYVLTDYGNGTYRTNFTAATSLDLVEVSVRVFDHRSIIVMANATCIEA